MTILEEMGLRTRKVRELRGMTQGELGMMMGYSAASSATMISYIEAGKRDIPVSKLALMADALNVSPTYLLGMEKGLPDDVLSLEQQNIVREFIETMRKTMGGDLK